MIFILIRLLVVITLLSFVAYYIKKNYDKIYEGLTDVSSIGKIGGLFPKRSKALKGYWPVEQDYITDVQELDNDISIYLKS